MAKLDPSRLKPHLVTYLRAQGIVPTADGYVPCPKHADHEPYENAHVTPDGQAVKCFVCQEPAWDVIAIEQMHSGADFKTACKTVAQIVGVDMGSDEPAASPSHLDKPKKQTVVPVPVSWEQAKTIFTHANLLTPYAVKTWGGTINGMWAAKNERGEVGVVDVRFERSDEKGVEEGVSGASQEGYDGGSAKVLGGDNRSHTVKSVISFFWDGQRIQSKGCPVVIFGRDLLAQNPTSPVCFHEGAKCWHAAKDIPGVVPLTWNRGVESVSRVDVEPVRGRVCYIYPDDDAPGRKAARALAARLRPIAASVKICAPMVSGPGFDVVDCLEAGKTPDEIRAWILEGPALEEDERGNAKQAQGTGPNRGSERNGQGTRKASPSTVRNDGAAGGDLPSALPADKFPFRVLGIDEGFAYFIDAGEHLARFRLTALTKGQLLTLAPLEWWTAKFDGGRGAPAWDEATDFLIEASQSREFDPDRARGRGAWRERDGRICYHDGHETMGEWDHNRLYIRKRQIDIGLADSPASEGERRAVLDAVALMNFETTADVVRALAWSALAPFGGASEWRPSMILTGDSGSGKSTILERVIVPLVGTPHYWSGIDSTAAGARQKSGNDSMPIIIDEAKGKTEAARKRREEFMALMQQSTSDNSPAVVKGTPSGDGPMSYTMRSMFLFSAVEEDTGNVEQENRLVVVNIRKPKPDPLKPAPPEWKEISARVRAAVTDMVCRGIRAYTWSTLPTIIDSAHALEDLVMPFVNHDTRRAFAEALLFSAFWLVFKNEAPAEKEFLEWCARLYEKKPLELRRNEADEMVQAMLDEVVPLHGDTRYRFPLRQILSSLSSGHVEDEGESITHGRELVGTEKQRYMQTAKNSGVYLVGGEVAIKSKSKRYQIAWGEHYSKTLRRHPGYLGKPATVNGLGDVVVITGLLIEDGIGPL